MIDVARVVEAWDWHVAGQAVRVFRPGWLREIGVDEDLRRRGVCEPWGFAGLVGVAAARDGSPVCWDAGGPIPESVSARVALAASRAWEAGEAPPPGLHVRLGEARLVPGPLAPLYRVEGGASLVLAASSSAVPMDWDHLHRLGDLANQMRRQAGEAGGSAVVVDPRTRRAVGFRPHGECWRGPADVLPAALAAARSEGWTPRELAGEWAGFTNIPVSVRLEDSGQAAHLGVAAHLVALRRFYDRPGALLPFVLR